MTQLSEHARRAIFESVVVGSNDLITVLDAQGRVVYVNDAVKAILGVTPNEMIGRNIVEFGHPEELERGMKTLALAWDYGAPPGNTHFRARRSDGTYVALEMSTGDVTDGENRLLMTIGREAETRFGLELILKDMLGGVPLVDVMANVCDTFSWRLLQSRVAFVWQVPGSAEQYVTRGGLPEQLSGWNALPGSLWQIARSELRGIHEEDLSKLPDDLRAAAEATGVGAYWIEPVSVGAVTALITVWTVAGGRPPSVHAQGMDLARSVVGIIMRWTDQQRRLDFAAYNDELTGLPNRKAFFRALADSAHGAILYCDLDGFKPVNDNFGHSAGDDVLRQVAERLRSCVRGDDIVARFGGDEFAVLCPGSTAADAAVLADRIRAAIAQPMAIGGLSLSIGISIGLSHTIDQLDEESIAAADRSLYEAKAKRKIGKHSR